MTLSFHIHITLKWDYIVSTMLPFLALILFACTIIMTLFMFYFWIIYLKSDYEEKLNKETKLQKQWKKLTISILGLIILGIVFILLPIMTGHEIDLN